MRKRCGLTRHRSNGHCEVRCDIHAILTRYPCDTHVIVTDFFKSYHWCCCMYLLLLYQPILTLLSLY